MNHSSLPYRIFPLGDAAITIDFGNCIDEAVNREVIARFHQLQQEPLPGMIEALPAYSSLTIYYDIVSVHKKIPAQLTLYEWMKEQLEEKMKQTPPQSKTTSRVIKIPVCYDRAFAMDMPYLASVKNISPDEIIQIHTSKTYKVFMLGFLPGFAYMGEVDERIAINRKPQPVNIQAGSVGIAGRQTGIYPLSSPGGWQIIGRTPLKLFEASFNPSEGGTSADHERLTLLKAGDKIQFYSITKEEFENY
ncbi:MAG: 5-oxoprolinase subunit PxpB [Chitinophagaceae bacterium]|nr:5-oxoprolinase subunit PxpB [Chitinophagaceae bacterium]